MFNSFWHLFIYFLGAGYQEVVVACDHELIGVFDRDTAIEAHISQMACLSIFDISYRNDANGKPFPEKTRLIYDFLHIKFWDWKFKEKGKGAKKTKLREKTVPKKVQDVWDKITAPKSAA